MEDAGDGVERDAIEDDSAGGVDDGDFGFGRGAAFEACTLRREIGIDVGCVDESARARG